MTQTMTAPRPAVGTDPTGARTLEGTVGCPSCGLPATVEWRAGIESTDGLVEHVKIRCPDRHWFLMPTYLLPDLV